MDNLDDKLDIQEVGKSEDPKFPVKVGNESHVDAYAKTLTKGEEQILVTREGGLYLTNGTGGYISVGTVDVPEIDLSKYYTKIEVDELIANVDVIDPNSHTHDNKSIINGLGDTNGILSYNGKPIVNDTENNYRTLPTFKNPKIDVDLKHIKSRGDM